MAFLPTGASSSILAFSSKKRNGHLTWPSGAGPQAISIMRASALPSSFRRALFEFILRFRLVMPLILSLLNSFTVFVTVARQTPFSLADYSWVRTFPWTSSRSIIIWHLQRTVRDVYFFCMTDFSSLSSSSTRIIWDIFGLAIGITAFFHFTIKRKNYPDLFIKYDQHNALNIPKER